MKNVSRLLIEWREHRQVFVTQCGVQLDKIDTFDGNVTIAEQFLHVRCWLPLN